MPGGASSRASGTSSSATGAAGATGSGKTVSPSAGTGSTGAAGAVVRPAGRLACFAVGRAAGRSAGLLLAAVLGAAFGAALGAAARLRGADMVITPEVAVRIWQGLAGAALQRRRPCGVLCGAEARRRVNDPAPTRIPTALIRVRSLTTR